MGIILLKQQDNAHPHDTNAIPIAKVAEQDEYCSGEGSRLTFITIVLEQFPKRTLNGLKNFKPSQRQNGCF